MEIADKIAIADLIQSWGLYRDQGRWQELRGTFTPDGHISVSWFCGAFEQFVEHCRASFDGGHTWSRHHLFTPVIKLGNNRAVAETSVIIRVRQSFKGIAVDLTSCSRFLDRIEKHPGGWLIVERAAIYERDRLVAGFRRVIRRRRCRALSGGIPLYGVSHRPFGRAGAGAGGLSR